MSKVLRLPVVLTPEERIALLKQPNTRYPTSLRNLALMQVMLDCGLRNAEIRGLKTASFNFRTGSIKVFGKGKKERMVYMGPEALDIVGRWFERRATLPDPEGFFFSTLQGTQVCERYVQQMVKRYAKKAGLKKNIHPHIFRHTFGHDIFSATHNIRITQRALGHSSLQNTMLYTLVSDPELEDAMKTFRKDGDKGGR